MIKKNLLRTGFLVCATTMLLVGCGNKDTKSTASSGELKANGVVAESTTKKQTETTTKKPVETTTEAPTEPQTEPQTEAPTEPPTEAPTEKPVTPDFTVNDMSATMYATQGANVRAGASTNYDVINHLSGGQEVQITGQASTGWYRINLNGQVGYCSDTLLSTSKPQPKPQPQPDPAPQSQMQSETQSTQPQFISNDNVSNPYQERLARKAEERAIFEAWAKETTDRYRNEARELFGHEPNQKELFVYLNRNWQKDIGFVYKSDWCTECAYLGYHLVYHTHTGVCSDAAALVGDMCEEYYGIQCSSNETTDRLADEQDHEWTEYTLDGKKYNVESWLLDYSQIQGTDLMDVINTYDRLKGYN